MRIIKKVLLLQNGHIPKHVWKGFCESTSIHGFDIIHKNKRVLWRTLSVIMWFTMLGLLIWSCTNSILDYYRFEVLTSIVHQTFTEIEFPAITFCNQNRISRSISGADDIVLWLDVMVNAQNMREMSTPLADFVLQQEKYCPPDKDASSRIPLSAHNNMSLLSIGKIFARDSINTVKKCWWNNKEIACVKLFFNHVLDYGLCFTFNFDTVFQTQKAFDLALMGYGINGSDISPTRIIKSASVNYSGLKLLMNTNQSEYCGLMGKWRGAGVLAMIHDRDQIFPSFFQETFMLLQPGYMHTIVLKPTVFRRKTAHLRRCANPIYKIENYHYYTQSLCRGLCFLTLVIENCKCVTSLTYGAEHYFSEEFRVPLDKFPICATVREFMCLKQTELDIVHNPTGHCPVCKQACYETTYEALTTSVKLLPSTLAFADLQDSKYANQTTISKNFMLTTFLFESMNIITVQEDQAFTVTDLFIYIGGSTGIFLGMSFMSFFEVLQYFIFCCHKCFRKRNNKVSQVRRNALVATEQNLAELLKINETRERF